MSRPRRRRSRVARWWLSGIGSLQKRRRRRSSAPGRSATGNRLLVDLRLETDSDPAVDIKHRPLDQRRVRLHQRNGLLLVETGLVGIGQFLEGRARLVEQLFPADRAFPTGEIFRVEAFGAIV